MGRVQVLLPTSGSDFSAPLLSFTVVLVLASTLSPGPERTFSVSCLWPFASPICHSHALQKDLRWRTHSHTLHHLRNQVHPVPAHSRLLVLWPHPVFPATSPSPALERLGGLGSRSQSESMPGQTLGRSASGPRARGPSLVLGKFGASFLPLISNGNKAPFQLGHSMPLTFHGKQLIG